MQVLQNRQDFAKSVKVMLEYLTNSWTSKSVIEWGQSIKEEWMTEYDETKRLQKARFNYWR
jgi:hypothetical protein